MGGGQSRPTPLTFLWHSVTPMSVVFLRAPFSPDAYLRQMNGETDLDVRGLLCPLPVLKARKRLLSMGRGERLAMLADDPAALIDVPHFCAEAGHRLIEQQDRDGGQLYVIEKG